ncbi:unnamed protein product [Vicia faba]|uniref:C2 domain-containing protein n=1 Tax=Vicia faba TaxID=3906 RepID=A0AAV0YMT0_VICFA|nr:unnamed protein product [Vicia faba]
MDPFNHSHQKNNFRYNPNLNKTTQLDDDEDQDFTGLLDIFVHHASNIHNICIYDNQDVYAKFSLTYNPDETLSTRIINKGGKNPTFNENLRMKITQMDALLKCEIWMFSRSRTHMEDQLLGFALVPISKIVVKGKVTQDYSLSSTDLFHSPAGIVRLTLSLHTSLVSESANSSSISSEVIFLDRKVSEVMLDAIEYSRIEFPDISVVKENQEMVSEYFNLAWDTSNNKNSRKFLPFLHLGSSSQLEMTNLSSPDANQVDLISISPNESIQNSSFVSSTITSLSDNRNSADSIEKKNHLGGDSTPTSQKEVESRDDEKEKKCKKDRNTEAIKHGHVFSSSLGKINLEAEECAMQKQIVDMYMRSMQQFTESLAKMKLPMDLDKCQREDHGGDVIQSHESEKLENAKKKDGSRVFYGSRAFF